MFAEGGVQLTQPVGRSELATSYRRNLLVGAPFAIAVPVVIGVALLAAGVDLQPIAVVAGVVGWMIALALRVPVGLLGVRILGDEERTTPLVVASSGPLEESVRLLTLVLLGRDLDTALSIALGWAAIEVVYAVVAGAATVLLLERGDPEAEELIARMPVQAALAPTAPLWGAWERLWATGLHFAFTLIIAARPVLVPLTMIAHSATNLAVLRVGKDLSLPRFQVLGAIWSAALLAVAIALWP
jgi:hypothetical protein